MAPLPEFARNRTNSTDDRQKDIMAIEQGISFSPPITRLSTEKNAFGISPIQNKDLNRETANWQKALAPNQSHGSENFSEEKVSSRSRQASSEDPTVSNYSKKVSQQALDPVQEESFDARDSLMMSVSKPQNEMENSNHHNRNKSVLSQAAAAASK